MVEEIKAMRERADIDGYLPQGMNEKEIRQIAQDLLRALAALSKCVEQRDANLDTDAYGDNTQAQIIEADNQELTQLLRGEK